MAISVIKTLRLLVADLAHKTAQNCTKMPARRCPRDAGALLAAAAPRGAAAGGCARMGRFVPPKAGRAGHRAGPYTWRAQKVRARRPALAAAARRGPRVAPSRRTHHPRRARARAAAHRPPHAETPYEWAGVFELQKATSTRGSRRRRAGKYVTTRWSLYKELPATQAVTTKTSRPSTPRTTPTRP